MTRIESKKVRVQGTAEQVFSFLSDMNNVFHLLPQDKISEWKSDTSSCSFKVQGAYTIGLQFRSSVPNEEICFESSAGSPFPFTLTAYLRADGSTTEAHQLCEAKINPFLEMMVKGPLKNLFDYMADKLSERSFSS